MEKQDERSLPEKASERLIEYILEKKLQKGDKLPNEHTLAQMLCVGRGTIREAVKILESRNIVTVKQGAGTFVCEKYGVADDPLGLCLMEIKRRQSRTWWTCVSSLSRKSLPWQHSMQRKMISGSWNSGAWKWNIISEAESPM